MGRTILFTADDFGLDEETNLAVERGYRSGVLTGASLMLGQDASAHAVTIANRNPGLQIGWHFHCCDSLPLTVPRWPWGRSPTKAGILIAVWPAARSLLRRELTAQWDRFQATGLSCSFINGHHHLHIHPFIAREMARLLSKAFTGWVRGFNAKFFDNQRPRDWSYGFLRQKSVRWLDVWSANRRSDSLWGLDRLFKMNAAEVAQVLPHLPTGLHEFLFHPRRDGDVDGDLSALLKLQPLLVNLARPVGRG